jgi:hypothetical protein
LNLTCAEGKKSPREELIRYGGAASFSWVRLWRKAKLGKVSIRFLRDSKYGPEIGKPQS